MLSLIHFPWMGYLIRICLLAVAQTTCWMAAWHWGAAGEKVPIPVPGSRAIPPADCTGPPAEELPLEVLSWLQVSLALWLCPAENLVPVGHGLWQPGWGYVQPYVCRHTYAPLPLPPTPSPKNKEVCGPNFWWGSPDTKVAQVITELMALALQ